MARKTKYTAKTVIRAIDGSKGFISAIAGRLGCTRKTVYNLLEKYPTAQEALVDEREKLTDFAEAKLFQMMDSGNTTATIFYLKCKGKQRGYIDRQEVDHNISGQTAVNVTIKYEND